MSETNIRLGINSLVAWMAGKSQVPGVESHLG